MVSTRGSFHRVWPVVSEGRVFRDSCDRNAWRAHAGGHLETEKDPGLCIGKGYLKNHNADLETFLGRFALFSKDGPSTVLTSGSTARHAAFAFLFFSALNLAHRAFVALEILALAAADITLFLTCVTSRTAVAPSAFAAARTPFN